MCYKCDGNFLWFITWMPFQTKPVTSPFFYHHMRKVPVHLLKQQRFPPIILIVWCTLESGINHSAIYCLLQSVLPECQPHLLKMNYSLHQTLLGRKKKEITFYVQTSVNWDLKTQTHTHTLHSNPLHPEHGPPSWDQIKQAGEKKSRKWKHKVDPTKIQSQLQWLLSHNSFQIPLPIIGKKNSLWNLKQFVSAIGK